MGAFLPSRTPAFSILQSLLSSPSSLSSVAPETFGFPCTNPTTPPDWALGTPRPPGTQHVPAHHIQEAQQLAQHLSLWVSL